VRLLHLLPGRLDRPSDKGYGLPEAELSASGDQGTQRPIPANKHVLLLHAGGNSPDPVAVPPRRITSRSSGGQLARAHRPYIENIPDLQLVDKLGVADPTLSTLPSRPRFSFYTRLIDDF